MSLDVHEPLPLKRWIRGTLRIHFTHGHVAEIEVDQATADRMRRKVDGLDGPDFVEAAGVSWLQFRDDAVVLLEWAPGADLGWGPTSPEDRQKLKENGHRHGVLQSLADIWAESGKDPSYCPHAMIHLFHAACSDLSPDDWKNLAQFLEGESGAQVVSDAEASLCDRDSTDKARARKQSSPSESD
ncbi:hypothetical protein, partial [Nocardioides sp. GCM10030258]|uniref:hypothetical protein n=1 Tax=unclassified Nocardioides TaxID=2615069 RepID=UPI003607DE17